MKLRLKNLRRKWKDEDGKDGQEPVSPTSQFLSSSALSLCVHAVFEFEESIDVSHSKAALEDILLPRNPRFSCIMAKDEHGMLHWEKTRVNVDDHVIVPEFRTSDQRDNNDALVNDYISKTCLLPLEHTRPLWQFHIINCKTSNAAATLIIKLHHSLGDGISLMSLMFACVRRADNPNLLPTFPTSKQASALNKSCSTDHWSAIEYLYGVWCNLCRLVLILWYTALDFMGCSLRMMKWIDDSKLPIRGPPGVEYLPLGLASATFQIDDIRQIKDSTVNDVITGIIFYGIQRYLQIRLISGLHDKGADPKHKILNQMENLRVTALAMINTRALSGLQPNTQTPWGNHFGFLHLPIPVGKFKNPLDFVRRAKHVLDRQKMSLGVFLTGRTLDFIARFKGPQASSKYMYNTIANTTLAISNMVGPMEKMAMAGNPIKSFFFSVSGAPQTLSVMITSYNGSLRMQVMATKAYIDADILSKCFAEAFEEIKEASVLHCIT
eukprot:Gb_40539 [translate_table: standard]